MKLALSWIDPAELRARLEAAGFSSSGSSVMKPAWRRPPDTAPSPPREKRRSKDEFNPHGGTLSARLAELMLWVERSAGAEGVFLCDGDGLVLAESNADPKLATGATWFASTWRSVGRHVASSGRSVVIIELDDGRWLLTASETTAWGTAHLGLCLPRLPGQGTASAVQRALSAALKEE